MAPTNHTKVAPSKIPGAGRGLFLTKRVKAGELIFSIPRPLIAIVSSDIIESVCDECFHYEGPGGRNFVPSKSERKKKDGDENAEKELLRCEGCGLVWYCSLACQAQAWMKHHEFECRTYSAIANDEASTDPRYRSIRSSTIRGLLRLLALKKHKQISEEDFQTYVDLSKGVRVIREKEESMLTNLMLKLDVFEGLEMALVEKLYLAAANNQCQLNTPNLLTTAKLEACPKGWFSALALGDCLDPYFSMMNHSCLPNAVWTFEGRELQVRAEKDSNAGEEVTISYTPYETFRQRTEDLNHWGIECLCKLCEKESIEPCGELHRQIDGTLSKKPSEDGEFSYYYLEEIETVVQKMKEHGLGWGAWPMKELHQKMYRILNTEGDLQRCLKILLKMRYKIEEEIPTIQICQRIDTMRLLTAVMGKILCSKNESSWTTGIGRLCLGEKHEDNDEAEQEVDDDECEDIVHIKDMVKDVYVGMWLLMVSDIETCYGETSSLARWERMRYRREIMPLWTSDFKKGSLIQLLSWAGVKVQSGKGTTDMIVW